MNCQANIQPQEKGKGRIEVTETEVNEDTTKTKRGELEKGTRKEREAEKNLHEETFKVC